MNTLENPTSKQILLIAKQAESAEKQLAKYQTAYENALNEKDRTISELRNQIAELNTSCAKIKAQALNLKAIEEEKDRANEEQEDELNRVTNTQKRTIEKQRETWVKKTMEGYSANQRHPLEMETLKSTHESELAAHQAEEESLNAEINSLQRRLSLLQQENARNQPWENYYQERINRASAYLDCPYPSSLGLQEYERRLYLLKITLDQTHPYNPSCMYPSSCTVS
jgi:chromosome segregation ATPase